MPDGDWFSAGRSGNRLAVSEMLSPAVLDAAVRLLDTGALWSICVSRDGGALGVTVTHDGEWRREWFTNSDELAAWLDSGATYIAALPARADRRRDPDYPGRKRR